MYCRDRLRRKQGTWTRTSSSNWSDTNSWLGGIVADGADKHGQFRQHRPYGEYHRSA